MAIEILPEPSIPVTTPFRPGLGFLTATPIIATASICLALVILSAILAPWLAPHDPAAVSLSLRLQPPLTPAYFLGTDALGQDVLSRVIFGARVSLLVGFCAVLISGTLGVTLGVGLGVGVGV